MKAKEQIVKEWMERGKHDLDAAKILRDSKYFDVAVFHIHQAIEKYLKAYLIHKGWKLKKIHDLESLITKATNFDVAFQKYLDLGRKLNVFYYDERYPPGPITPHSKEEVEEMLEAAEEIINKLKEEIER
ncbi:MAG: HEPN domain-containing protein [Candidatus Freyarchaeum deiterrae]